MIVQCGYDISRTSAIGRYLTSGMSGTAKRFFDNCWDAIETLGLSDMYSAYSTISDFAPDLITIIRNANSLEMYRNADGTYTVELRESGIDPQEYYDNVNGMYESTPEELEAIKRISAEQENNQKSEISDTDSSSSSTITGDTNDNGSSDGDLTKTDDDENDSDPLSGDIIERFPYIKNETNMPPKSRLTFWGHNHMLMFLSVDSRNSGDSFLENVENYSCGVERSENRHAVLYRAAAYRNAVVIVNS